MKRIHHTAGGLAFSLAVALAPSAGAQTNEPVKFATGIDAAYVSIYIAKQDKLFAKHGVNVDIMQFTQGGDSLDAVVANQAVVGSAAEPTTLIRIARTDIKVLGIIGQSATYIKLVVKPEINDAKQIKKLGVVLGSVSEFSTEQMFSKFGIDPKSVEFIKGGPPEFPALLARGDIDGYFLWEPWPTNGVKAGGKILMTSGDVGYAYNMWVSARADWLATHQAEAKKMMAALAEGCQIANADPVKAAAAVQAEAKIPAATATAMLKEVECVVRDFTATDMGTYQKIADFLTARKIIPSKMDVSKVVLQGFVKP